MPRLLATIWINVGQEVLLRSWQEFVMGFLSKFLSRCCQASFFSIRRKKEMLACLSAIFIYFYFINDRYSTRHCKTDRRQFQFWTSPDFSWHELDNDL